MGYGMICVNGALYIHRLYYMIREPATKCDLWYTCFAREIHGDSSSVCMLCLSEFEVQHLYHRDGKVTRSR